jgi:putative transposase
VKFRLYPNQFQEAKFQVNTDATRFVWNTYLAARDHNYSRKLSGLEPLPVPTLSEAKQLPGFEWLQEAESTSLRQVQIDLDRAYSQWFSDMKKEDGTRKKGKPRFQSRFTAKQSFRVQMNMEIDPESRSIRAAKHGWIKARGDWYQVPAEGSIQTITVSKAASGWYASVLFRVPPVVVKNDFPFVACV